MAPWTTARTTSQTTVSPIGLGCGAQSTQASSRSTTAAQRSTGSPWCKVENGKCKWQVESGGDVWATLAILDALLLTVVGHHIGHERPCGTQLEDWNLGASLAGPPMVKHKKQGDKAGATKMLTAAYLHAQHQRQQLCGLAEACWLQR